MFNVNQYFEGKVASISHNGDGGKATVGVIAPGEFSFDTATIEIMTVVAGEMEVQLPGELEWKTYKGKESFRVDKDQTFKVRTNNDTPYLCEYL